VEFEWDETKNRKNRRKHRVNLESAKKLFVNPILERVDNRKDYGEERLVALGEIEGIVFVVTYTTTETGIHVISMRKALKYEQKKYYLWRYEKGSSD
jgi:uncharacterized DUF497 family protein